MSDDFLRVVLRTEAQWRSGARVGLRPCPGGALGLYAGPARAEVALPAAGCPGAVDAATLACHALAWVAPGGPGWVLRLRRGLEEEPIVVVDLTDLGLGGATRLRRSGGLLWLVDATAGRAVAVDPASWQIVREERFATGAVDVDVDAQGRLLILGKEQLRRSRDGVAEDVIGKGTLHDARAIATGADGTIVVADATAPGRFLVLPGGDPAQAVWRGNLARDIHGGLVPSRLLLGSEGQIFALDTSRARTLATIAPDGAYQGTFGDAETGLVSVAVDGDRLLGVGAAGLLRISLLPGAPGAAPEPGGTAVRGAAPLLGGRYYSRSLDSGPRPDGLWHRVDFDVDLPEGTLLEVSHVFSDDALLRDAVDRVFDLRAPGGERDDPAIAETLERRLRWSERPQILLGSADPAASRGAAAISVPRAPLRSVLLRDDEAMAARGGASSSRVGPPHPPRWLWLRLVLRALPGAFTPRAVDAEPAEPVLRSAEVLRPRQSYLRYLPAIYQEDASSRLFLDRFLSAFETQLGGIEREIDELARCFDPERAPVEFLDWLAAWFGLSLDPSWDESTRRALLAEAASLLRRKGTVAGIERLVEILTGSRPAVLDGAARGAPTRLGRGGVEAEGAGPRASRLGLDTLLVSSGRSPPRLGVLPLGASRLGTRAGGPAQTYRARAYRATVRLDVPASRRASVEAAVRAFTPAHVALDFEPVVGDDRLLAPGAAVGRPEPAPVGSLRLGVGTTTAPRRAPTLSEGRRIEDEPRLS